MDRNSYLRVVDVVEFLYQNRYKYFPDFNWRLTYSGGIPQEERLALGEKLHLQHGLKTFGKENIFQKFLDTLSGNKSKGLGIDPRKIFSSDVQVYKGPIHYSDRFMIKGKPDYVIPEQGNQVPIEYKPMAKEFFPHNEWQVKLYCLLLDPYSKYVQYGYLEIADGSRKRVEVTQEDKIRLVKILQGMGYQVRM